MQEVLSEPASLGMLLLEFVKFEPHAMASRHFKDIEKREIKIEIEYKGKKIS